VKIDRSLVAEIGFRSSGPQALAIVQHRGVLAKALRGDRGLAEGVFCLEGAKAFCADQTGRNSGFASRAGVVFFFQGARPCPAGEM